MKPLASYTCNLSDEQASALLSYLQKHSFELRDVPYARFAGANGKVSVVFYESGKLVVQGKGTQEFIEFVMEPEILKQARLGYETVLNPDMLIPRLGVDESGKGDFFGPLCVAGVYVNEDVVKAWRDKGIRVPGSTPPPPQGLLPPCAVATVQWFALVASTLWPPRPCSTQTGR